MTVLQLSPISPARLDNDLPAALERGIKFAYLKLKVGVSSPLSPPPFARTQTQRHLPGRNRPASVSFKKDFRGFSILSNSSVRTEAQSNMLVKE